MILNFTWCLIPPCQSWDPAPIVLENSPWWTQHCHTCLGAATTQVNRFQRLKGSNFPTFYPTMLCWSLFLKRCHDGHLLLLQCVFQIDLEPLWTSQMWMWFSQTNLKPENYNYKDLSKHPTQHGDSLIFDSEAFHWRGSCCSALWTQIASTDNCH